MLYIYICIINQDLLPYNHFIIMILKTPADVIEFWFGSTDISKITSVQYIIDRMPIWFSGKSLEFDMIQKENIGIVEYVGSESLFDESWHTETGVLARIILLDQFARCIYRGTVDAFKYDELTSRLVKKIIESDLIERYVPIQKFFLGVAIQHSEDLEMQKLGLYIASIIFKDDNEDVRHYFSNIKGYPNEHHDVIARFGRFPGRNYALNRDSTSEEIEWMNSDDCPNWAKSQLKAIK